jgi:hypothetical protein
VANDPSGVAHAAETRFWCEPHLAVELDDAGFLAAPRDDGFRTVNPHLLSTRDLASLRCVVLLGEPGMGKTYVLDSHRPLLAEVPDEVDPVHLDLAAYNEARLITLFEGDDFTRWREGTRTLCLTLDGFDEAHRRIQNLPALVVDYVKSWPIDRLYLRIACRTAEWPTWASERLRRHFPDALAVELQPLRQQDLPSVLPVDIPSEQLLAAVREIRVGPFAARPITLNLLARIFRESSGSLPQRPADLYRRGTELDLGQAVARALGEDG